MQGLPYKVFLRRTSLQEHPEKVFVTTSSLQGLPYDVFFERSFLKNHPYGVFVKKCPVLPVGGELARRELVRGELASNSSTESWSVGNLSAESSSADKFCADQFSAWALFSASGKREILWHFLRTSSPRTSSPLALLAKVFFTRSSQKLSYKVFLTQLPYETTSSPSRRRTSPRRTGSRRTSPRLVRGKLAHGEVVRGDLIRKKCQSSSRSTLAEQSRSKQLVHKSCQSRSRSTLAKKSAKAPYKVLRTKLFTRSS